MTTNGRKFFGLSIKRSLIRLDLGFYWFWAILRVVLTLFPQLGYIHPDEYFQTVEVFAGDVFDTDVSLPWEFNTTNPIRSVVMTYVTMQIPLKLLKIISEFLILYCNVNILTPYFVLIAPRLTMCLLSFVSDFCLYKICYLYGQNYKERLIIFSSSYVCLIFLTRTFNNSIEVLCFNLLLYLVATCMAESEKINYQKSYLKGKYNEATSVPDQVRIKKLMKVLPQHSLSRCLGIATVTVGGLFNRPTFICYAIPPLFYWVQRGMGTNKSSFVKEFHSRVLLLAIYALPCVCLFIFIDSAFYGYLTWGEVLNKRIYMSNFVVTPLNFIKYNLDSSNLSKHGLHPRFIHILVNIPLLFNVLGVSAFIIFIKMAYRGSLSYWTLLPKSQSITGMMTLCVIFPVLALSIIPHQEPRFILPILLPLVFLYSHLVKDFQEHCTSVIPFKKRVLQVNKIEGLNLTSKCIQLFKQLTENFENRFNVNGRFLTMIKHAESERKVFTSTTDPKEFKETFDSYSSFLHSTGNDTKETESLKPQKINVLLIMWYILNIICALFFGFLHQGGVYPLAKYINEDLTLKPRLTVTHLVTSHIYSFPVHLLMLKNTKRLRYNRETGKRYLLAKNFYIYELGSENMDRVYAKLNAINRVADEKRKQNIMNYKLYYAFPLSILEDFKEKVQNYSDFSYDVENIFYPHLSTEAFPNFNFMHNDNVYNSYVNSSSTCKLRGGSILGALGSMKSVQYLGNFLKQFGLVLVSIYK